MILTSRGKLLIYPAIVFICICIGWPMLWAYVSPHWAFRIGWTALSIVSIIGCIISAMTAMEDCKGPLWEEIPDEQKLEHGTKKNLE